MNTVKLLHDITQLGYSVYFDSDFEGMITITFKEEHTQKYIRHEHVSFPGSSDEHLTNSVDKCLTYFLNEAREGSPQKDGLAD
jgi:hypothetical protein